MNAVVRKPRRGLLAVRAEGIPNDLPEIIAGLTKSFEDFKKINNRRLEEAIAAANRAAIGGVPQNTNDIAAQVQAFNAAIRDATNRPSNLGQEELRRYIAAETDYWRMGAASPLAVRAEMSTAADAEGGFVVSPERAAEIKRRIFESSPIRQLATVQPTSKDVFEIIHDANDPASGGWVQEKGDRPETDTGRIALQKIEVSELYAMPKITARILDDGDIDIGAYVVGKIADRFSRDEATAFVTGNGLGRPRGILAYADTATTEDDAAREWGKLQYVVSGSATGFPYLSGSTIGHDADSLIDLQSRLKPNYLPNAVWLMARSTGRVVRKLKDTEGRYIWLDNLTDGGRPLLLGHPVVFAEDMPPIASDSFSIAFGDFKAGYTIVDRFGIRVLRDPYTTKGWTKFYATKRVGGDVTGFDAIKLLKFAAS